MKLLVIMCLLNERLPLLETWMVGDQKFTDGVVVPVMHHPNLLCFDVEVAASSPAGGSVTKNRAISFVMHTSYFCILSILLRCIALLSLIGQ